MKSFDRRWLITLVPLLIIAAVLWRHRSQPIATVSPTPSVSVTVEASDTPSPTASPNTPLSPVADFQARITKKRFGQYIMPATSPVQPERFTGYHTGVDVEYADVTTDVTVHAIAAGKVLTARTASGYGGVVAIQHVINGQNYIAIYGHLDPASLIANGATVSAGQRIGVLGADKSTETDGERKHLHFGIVKGTTLTIAGYVQTQAVLSKWIDPLSLYQ